MTSYLIKSILCSGILIVVYHLFLEREKMLVFNRFYLLTALIFSLVVPLISFDVELPSSKESLIAMLPDVDKKIEAIPYFKPSEVVFENAASNISFDYKTILFYTISGLLLMRFAFNIFRILRLKSRCSVHISEEAHFVLVPQDIVTYTFLNNIFIPEKSFENQEVRNEIVTHELAHVRQMHSLDILFIGLFQALMWFNPFLFLYKKAIRLNHEFLADEAVLKEYQDVGSYQLLLLDTILLSRKFSLTSSFNYSITKKRLAMMTKIKNINRQYVKQTFVVVITALLTIVFSEKIYSQVEAQSEKIVSILPEVDLAAFEKSETQEKPESQKEKIQGIVPGPGASESEVKELYTTIAKHTTLFKNVNGRIDPIVRMWPKMEDRMYAIFSKMNREQLLAAQDSGLVVFQMPVPVKKSPTPEMFENWKREDVFGVWLDGWQVPNSTLNKYKHTDIVEYDMSTLYGAALKGRKYKYQLDLTTNQHFDKTYQARMSDRVSILRVGWVGERPKSFAKKPKV